MKPLKEYDAESILSKELFEEIFEIEDLIERSYMIADLSIRAKELKVKSQFDSIIRMHEKVLKQITREEKAKKRGEVSLENWTNFTGGKYNNLYCGAWIATDRGVYAQNFMSPNDIIACYHPILPAKRLKNLETGEEQIVLAFKRNGRWEERKVKKNIIASANKIIALSDYGISVTSENAKHLVKYLSDVENLNDDHIEIQLSTTKLGWHGKDFIPYDTNIMFDGDGSGQFKDVYEAIHQRGSEDIWLEYVKKLRKIGRIEVKFALAASFASVLINILDALPFFIDFWGESGCGKSVSLMLACSVWANPDKNQYIGDFDSSTVGWEVRADMLNHLPMILDDTSKGNDKVKENLETLVYSLTSGKGKTRSNKELGMRRENRWKNCTLISGERPLQGYVSQGGAINRILEVECLQSVYANPGETVGILKKNYGFAGKKFVEIIKAMDLEELKSIYESFVEKLYDEDKTQKQIMSLAVVLTADKIATEYIFKDKCYISLHEAKETLVDQNVMSDNERCYNYLLDKVFMNENRFDSTSNIEKWGIVDGDYVYFYLSAFEGLCKSGNYSKKAFLSWADRKGLILKDKDRTTKQKRFAGKNNRCIALSLKKLNKDGFASADGEVIPFEQ